MGQARFFAILEDSIQCKLCPRYCRLAAGEKGQCGVRVNRDGKPAIPYYGLVTGMALDPIEKKPLYHFRPGSEIFSVGFAGCNLHCPFCQNWHISQGLSAQSMNIRGQSYTPAELINAVISYKPAKYNIAAKQSIAYTYSEPLVHIEYLLDCMKEARKIGLANVLVSNGCINSEAAAELLELCDAANIDLKCFSEETYLKLLGGDLSLVLDFIRAACERGVHIELTTLVVPGLNDSEKELAACVDFIVSLNKKTTSGKSSIPWHLSAYHPNWKWKAPPTSPELLNETAVSARSQLSYVYTGNIRGEKNDTPCPYCGEILIKRRGFQTDISGLKLKEKNGKGFYFCSSCGEKAPISH